MQIDKSCFCRKRRAAHRNSITLGDTYPCPALGLTHFSTLDPCSEVLFPCFALGFMACQERTNGIFGLLPRVSSRKDERELETYEWKRQNKDRK
jgi:hypothetical protein